MYRLRGYAISTLFLRRMTSGSVACLVALGTLLGASPAQAGGAAALPAVPPNRITEELITVGTRGGRERTAVNSAVPVDAFNLEDLKGGGQTELSRMLQMAAPSFNFSTSTISDGTDIVRPATLRGMQPDQTLVLVNGKRRHTSALMHVNGSIGRGTAGVDLNAIPAAAIQRIEILRDGASAQYGSDAIAGVINVVMKDQTDSIDPFIQFGSTYENDGDQLVGSINGGFPIFGDGFVNLTGEYRDRGRTNRAGLDQRQLFTFDEQVLGQPQLSADDCAGGCTLDPREDTFNRKNHRYGDPDSENIYFGWNAMAPLGSTELYTFGTYATREGQSGGFYRRDNDGRSNPQIHFDSSVAGPPGTNGTGFLPLINTDVDDISAGLGLRFGLLTFDWDTSVVYSENEFEFTITNSNNVALGLNSPTSAKAGKLMTDLLVFNIDGARDLNLFYNSTVSVGFEYREDGYKLTPGEEASWIGPTTIPSANTPNQFGGTPAAGIQVFPGFQPANARDDDRDAIGLYAGLDMDFTERWMVGIAVRYEDYSDFGDTINGKLSTRWNVVDNIALRASASTGFRAPALQQQFFNSISTQFVDVNGALEPQEVGTFANDSAVVRDGFGIPQLQEETSVNLSAGFAWTPTDNLTVTTDFYYITVEDRVVLSGRFQPEDDSGGACLIAGACPIRELLAPFDVASAQFFSNAIDTETKGIDIIADYSKDVGPGFMTLRAGLNFNDVQKDGDTKVPDTLVNSPGAADTLYSRQETIWLEDGQPQEHWILSANYDVGRFGFMLRGNWFGEVKSTESSGDPTRDQTFDGKWLVDLEGKWSISDSFTVVLGANNIFDVTPDKNIDSNSFGGIFPYNRRTTPFGFNGGYYYASLNMSFGNGT